MTTYDDVEVSVLGLGAMGSALAAALLKAGHPTTVWNRSAGKAGDLVGQGAVSVDTAGEAVRASRLVIACLLDHASVHEVLDPLAAELTGRVLVNLTTTSPAQARELAAWAADAGVEYLDGGIMAVPAMIGQPGSSILYSGSAVAFEQYKPLFDQWGASSYHGTDAGLASLYDLALLAGMYVMFAGFVHGAAMVAPAGMTAGEFAAMAAPWLTAMTGAFQEIATVVDGGDYTVAGQQSLEFSDLGDIVAASSDQGISTEVVDMVQRLIRRQIDAGHGTDGFARIVESIRQPG
ncbi:NAD(P)-dependent oxidoreductase [Plantactinospora soyae]|uniref:3-hydroxyisobutyrate dehydrogenase-like beta-hydroxyacid dehydrogenase n=1 Tax=Plantactinospora soyae TaxID=1544732 RepID=A0A927QVQ3_9ACTN|nr:NAD(P)-binding domain-containing protein [Plantactinospora soyae]MBE1484652.1 3-hydroxyisobutyrate dehydrogenase-like beta-hydroxyacid dehydrogenase [Plantactinospora soyae]